LTVNVTERELLLALAVTVTEVSEETVPAVTLKLALLAPDATTTDAGVVNAALLSVSVTVTPPDGAAPLSVTVQPSVWVEITCEPGQVSAVTVRRGALRVSVKERELLLALAVRSTEVVALTADPADAVNPAVDDPDGTVTEVGIETLELFFERDTTCPPLGAAPLKVTVQLADPGGVRVPGVQLKLVTVRSVGGGGCEMVTVPLLLEDGIEVPEADDADVFEICTTLDVAAVPAAMVTLTTATTPFAIGVVLNPATRQVAVPELVEHDTDFPAPEAAAPVVTLIADSTDGVYPIVHCRPVGCAPPLFARERFSETVLPGVPVADDRFRETDCPKATDVGSSVPNMNSLRSQRDKVAPPKVCSFCLSVLFSG
jgi:hypothetical protein